MDDSEIDPHMHDETARRARIEERASHETRRFVERVVIGLGLCPFARAPWEAGQVDVVVSRAQTESELLEDLAGELDRLQATPTEVLETTLLVHPHVLARFDDFNAFLDPAEDLLAARELEGVLQIASFHPDYRFAGAPDDDPANATNRSPWPMLHLLREASVGAAVDAHPDAAAIPERNVSLLREMAPGRVRALLDALRDADLD
jgi:hypothetical protein